MHKNDNKRYGAPNFYEITRKWIVFGCILFASAGFWGFLAAGFLRSVTDVSENIAIFIARLIGLIFSVWYGPRLMVVLRRSGIIG